MLITHFAKILDLSEKGLETQNFDLQVSAGWKHGDSVDEKLKCHPLLKPYKALSEKVSSVMMTHSQLWEPFCFELTFK